MVVIDPRCSETARAFGHISINRDGDAVLFDEGLEDRGALDRLARGGGLLRDAAARFLPEATEARTGVPAAAVRAVVRSHPEGSDQGAKAKVR